MEAQFGLLGSAGSSTPRAEVLPFSFISRPLPQAARGLALSVPAGTAHRGPFPRPPPVQQPSRTRALISRDYSPPETSVRVSFT